MLLNLIKCNIAALRLCAVRRARMAGLCSVIHSDFSSVCVCARGAVHRQEAAETDTEVHRQTDRQAYRLGVCKLQTSDCSIIT